jgi:hypothetical protein
VFSAFAALEMAFERADHISVAFQVQEEKISHV